MKYADLFDFEPLESVKELAAADDIDQAEEDVRTFVISDRLADQLGELIFPHLRFDKPAEGGNKGLLVVANYGTGKTHLMSVISSIAEHADLRAKVTHPEVAEKAEPISGRFHVIRAEIGSTKITSLHDIVAMEIEKGLEKLGIDFEFSERATGSKEDIVRMMAVFEEKYPDKGLLFVLDELLDYLRQLKDAELIQALMFLREVGEIARSTRFRFMSGVQEAIFDNPRFAHVADAVRRVKDRFEQIRISREDVAFVVRERLLSKTAEQRGLVRDHLTRFASLYEGMAERMDDFVSLYPVHPAYLRTFELISIVEKRTVLKTISQEMRRLIDSDVPEDEPGVICSDSYRSHLASDPAFRSIPAVRDVLDRTEKLRAKIDQGLADRQYVPTALRIVDGLAVHRLTTDEIDQPIGMTPENLRDELLVLPPDLPKHDAKFLAMTVKTILGKIITAVSGQFLSENPQNGQFYLDVDKDIDYDQNIGDRAQVLDSERLDDAYFRAIEELLDRRDAPYVSGYRIWEYQVEWVSHNVTRIGYLFMGAPNERSTAQPPRDYYMYFLQPYAPPKFEDGRRADEVFFRLEKPEEDFTLALRRYAGAYALERESTGRHRDVYADKRKTALKKMVDWLRSNMGTAISVTYRGDTQPLAAHLSARVEKASIKEQLDVVASVVLAGHFADRYPDYPSFTALITKDNLDENVRQALSQIASGRATVLGSKILESLDLVDSKGNLHAKGAYASQLLMTIEAAGKKVVNRGDLLTERDPGLETWEPWHLEPAWLVVVAAALVQLGRAELGYPGLAVDALKLDRLVAMGQRDLEAFSHIGAPKELPVINLRRIAGLLGLPEAVIPEAGLADDVVREIITKATGLSDQVDKAVSAIHERGQLWGSVLFDRADELEASLGILNNLLQDVRNRNTPGKMSQIDVPAATLDKAFEAKVDLEHVEAVLVARDRLDEVSQYLRQAVDVFGKDFELSAEAEGLRDQILAVLTGTDAVPAQRVNELRNEGSRLRKRFAEAAAKGYRHNHLDAEGDQRKKALLQSGKFSNLSYLSSLDLLPGGTFADIQTTLTGIRTLMEFDEDALKKGVLLPDVAYHPGPITGMSARARFEDIERKIHELHENWTKTLVESLQTEEIAEQIALLGPKPRKRVQAFVESGQLPDDLDDPFVSALSDVFRRFQVFAVTPDEVWAALFPEDSPTTLGDLRQRFDSFAAGISKKGDADRLRIVPKRIEPQEESDGA
jgi:hypothetical protein